jgi:hypothetical protein
VKKLLILSNKVPYPSQDGSSIAMARLLEDVLALQTFEITYGALNTKKHFKDPKDIPIDIARAIEFKIFNVNTSPTIYSALNNLFFSRAPYHSIRFFVKPMIEWLRGFEKNQFDFVLLEGAFMGDYLNEAKRIGKSLHIAGAQLRTLESGREPVKQVLNPVKNWYLTLQSKRLKKFEMGLVENINSVWSISEEDKKWFEKFNRKTTAITVSIQQKEPVSNLIPLACFHLGALGLGTQSARFKLVFNFGMAYCSRKNSECYISHCRQQSTATPPKRRKKELHSARPGARCRRVC